MSSAGTTGWWKFPRRHPVWTSVAAVSALLALLLTLAGSNWAKGPVQRIVSGATGREFRIDGDFDIDFLPLRISAEKVFLGNARWSNEPAMARVERVDMRLRFWPLLAGRFTLPWISLERPWLRLERNADGIGNWVFGKSCRTKDCPQRLRILQFYARDGQLQVEEPTLHTALELHFESTRPASDKTLAPLVLHGRGTYRDAPFGLAGHVDSPLELQGKPQPYEFDLTAHAGDTTARASGTLAEPLQTRDVAVDFEVAGRDLAELYDLVGIAMPRTPPYSLKGLLSRHGNRYSYEGFFGTVGDSDLSGIASIDVGGPRMKLTASLKSRRIKFDDLSGFIGGKPAADEGPRASAGQKPAASARLASGKRLPSRPIGFAKLRSMDADVELIASRVQSPKLPLESISAHLVLEDGLLTLTPLEFAAAGGKLAASVAVDARQIPADFTLAMQVRQLQLPKLMPKAKLLRDSTGSISGAVNLDGQGDSAATILATADGEIGFIMGAGRMSNLLLEIAGLDVAETLGFLIGKDQEVLLRCAYADFSVEDGIASARSVAIDTTDTALLIRGGFSFRDESLDLTLLPRPKDMSPLSIRTPIRIGGTFTDPAFAPKGKPLLLRGAAVAALASVAPPLALLGLIETGPGKDTDCGRGAPQAKEKKHKDKAARDAPGSMSDKTS